MEDNTIYWKWKMEMEKWNVCVQGETGLYRRTLGNPAANSLTCLTPYRPDLFAAHTRSIFPFPFPFPFSISFATPLPNKNWKVTAQAQDTPRQQQLSPKNVTFDTLRLDKCSLLNKTHLGVIFQPQGGIWVSRAWAT